MPQQPRRDTRSIPDAAPWEMESAAQQRARRQTDEVPMIGRNVRHTPGHAPADFSRGIEPDAWKATPGQQVETTGAGRRQAGKDYFGGIVMIMLGIGVAAIGFAGVHMGNQNYDPASGTSNPGVGYWAAVAGGMLALLRGLMILMKKV